MPKITFNNQLVPQGLLDVESLGNVCIEATNEGAGLFYYLLIKTSLGVTSIFEYGPIEPDFDRLWENYTVSYSRFSSNDKKLTLYVSKWLNDKIKGITAAKIITESDFVDNYKDIRDTIAQYGEDIY